MAHKVICINRLCGSGGHIIGEKVAERLGIGYYDRNLLDMALEYGGISSKSFHNADEKATNPMFYRLHYEGNEKVDKGKPANETVFQLQRDLMREITEQEDCVLIGRCADYILNRSHVNMVSVFVTAPFDFRVMHMMASDDLTRRMAVVQTKKIDKRREDYYRYFTKQEWKNPDNYELMLNSAALGFDKSVDLLCDYYEHIL